MEKCGLGRVSHYRSSKEDDFRTRQSAKPADAGCWKPQVDCIPQRCMRKVSRLQKRARQVRYLAQAEKLKEHAAQNRDTTSRWRMHQAILGATHWTWLTVKKTQCASLKWERAGVLVTLRKGRIWWQAES